MDWTRTTTGFSFCACVVVWLGIDREARLEAKKLIALGFSRSRLGRYEAVCLNHELSAYFACVLEKDRV